MAASLLLVILLIVALLILGFIVALYLVPVATTIAIEKTGEVLLLLGTVVWGIFGVRFRVLDEERTVEVLLAGRAVLKRDLAAIAEEEKPEEVPKERPPLRIGEYVGAGTDLWPYIRRVIDAFLRSLSLKRCIGEVTLGLASPAATGRIYGYMTALRYALWPVERIDLVMHPVFGDEILEGKVDVQVNIERPLTILIPIVAALMHKTVRDRLRVLSGRGAAGA
ncbi:DUF2953 domain-containing protein [Methanoculleus sp. FWC-SCC1]|uniref:DUF2953 domain-containing protein n=1 Tax=Methanoculleus frigidifontis TaxID=2584085 RepID=A0ABT8MA39_9EURY|nr:DUF2953 domain-containing protein [Methanoculleus sp. FWC-SCC1]MDN7024795.1 DUF2953 domain-containing protein [Methanoculleus sp. FWC-SCC1]